MIGDSEPFGSSLSRIRREFGYDSIVDVTTQNGVTAIDVYLQDTLRGPATVTKARIETLATREFPGATVSVYSQL